MIGRQKHTGYILLPVIVVITLVAAIALLMNTESALESNTAASELDAQQAQYVAEAGLNHALWRTQQQGCGPYSDLTDEPLGNDNYTTVLTTDLGSTTSYTVTVDQDAWIASNNPGSNKGNDPNLHVKFVGGDSEYALYRYDLSTLPPSASVLSATAWFYVNREHPEGPLELKRLNADWTEADATWDTLGDQLADAVLASIPAQPVADVWVSVNLTAQVQAWINGQPNQGLAITSTIDLVNAEYQARDAGNPPYLDVIVGTPPTLPALLKANGTLANGVTRSITRSDVTLRQQPASTVLWQHDAVAGIDAYIWEFSPTTRYGNDAETWVSYSNNNDALSLFKFNVDKLLPGTKILDATLSLLHQSGAGSNVPISAHRIVNPWDEADVTWRERVSGTDWDTFGGDLDNGVVSTTLVGPTSNIRYEWDLTSLAQGWADNAYPNYGVALRTTQTNAFGERFYTSDETIENRRPRLTITYACACGSACIAPQGTGNVLLLRNKNDPDPTDDAKQELFEAWGYTVNLLDDWDTQAAYDAAMASNDVMFISGASPFAVGTKLNNAPIGVVNERGELNDELGIATGRASPVGDTVDVVDTDHYITQIFPIAPLQVMTADVELTTVGGTIAPGAQILAEIAGTGALVALDTGQVSSGGGASPARRVLLPAGESEVDWLMTNNGALIVQRALEWGMNKKTTPTEPIVLSTASSATLGGLTFTDKDLAEYDPDADNATLYLDGIALGLAQDIDAVHVLTNGHIVLSAINTITLGGITSENEDLIDYDPVADSATLMFDGSALFTSGSTDISAVHVLDNGHLLLTNEYTATLGGLSFGPNDIVDYDPVANSATLFFDGDAVGFSGWINAVHLLGNGHIVLSTDLAATLGGINLEPGDLADYDPIADTATLFLDGDLFSAAENVRSAHVGPGSGGDAAPGPFKVLFVVGNVGGPGMTAEEVAHQTLIESWGHTVEIIEDGASQAAFDSAVANNDVVFTTNDITASSLGTKLVNATIGVVTSEDNLSDEFGLASAIAWESGTLVEINDNTHYITSPFPTGVLTILTASESLAYVTGTLSPDLGLLASSASGYGIVTLETGDALFGGGNAAGRRAQLPWGGNGFDPGNLNADGLEILKRALEWGAGAGADTGPIAHWKLDETSGPVAVDSVGGHDGTWTNDPVPTPGIDNGALSFDGSNDYVDLTSDAELDDVFLGGATAMAWINPAGWGENGYGRIFDKSSSPSATDDGWVIRMNVDNGGLNFGQGFTGGRGWWRFAESSINFDTWQHIALAYDASSTTNDPIVYLDGNPVAVTRVDTPSGDLRSDAAINLRLGNYAGGTTHTFDGIIDDARIYDRMLGFAEIADIAAAGGGGVGASYTELSQAWSATTNNTWQTVDLASFGVPANAVVEVAVENKMASGEFWGGVRAVGSGLERRFLLHEAEGGGVDTVTLHVQTDGSSQIQHYSGSPGFVSFRLLGYWTGATYVERFDAFKAGADASWQSHDLGSYGVGPNQVAEIALSQTSTSIEWLVGARRPGSGLARQIWLHEAEGGGTDVVTLMAATDASSIVQVYAGADSVVDFHLLGYWSTPPGTYTETGGVQGQATVSASWQTTDLSGFGIPANSIAQFVMSNQRDARENQMGLRETGSTINLRRLDLQEAESGGGDLGTMHVKVDASSQIQWAAEYGATEGFFYPVGWWDLTP